MLGNFEEANTMAFPQEIPLLKLITSHTIKRVGGEYQTNHLKRLGAKVESRKIDCTHFIYQTNLSDISISTGAFLESIEMGRSFYNKSEFPVIYRSVISGIATRDTSGRISPRMPGWNCANLDPDPGLI